MQQSNTYIIAFAAGLTIVLGGLLSLAAVGLKEQQQISIELDTKKQILSAVMDVEGKAKQDLAVVYDERIKSTAINYDGEVLEDVVPEDINVDKEYKKEPEDRKYPVYMFMSESDPEKYEAIIVPIYGFGLWDYIWGYVALEDDLNTIKGVSFDHKGETPGLGARITDLPVQQRYQGKTINDESGKYVSVEMVKGENHTGLGEHEVDGLSGATMTANGVNDMLYNYLEYYQAYLKKLKGGESISSL
ncbi:NADH:ubiquinone reductase (Na(+)-transporting) subunit C [Chondrinema litorale]|uniref:NADH:ubiquinone reductase (Na(+)-transporting) subunit C n=1 Tax=Chondrinema litorale TaxID=2994555 RepID=UPI002542F9E0|nr:NADH:ubiquinone reductase (Na(+)-transporting) subunit C [Chondrinema litorale]UZR94614.1 NADH:ubiquinone reductase (Na(+)-transporting) subunit C [Chondrinema litorale]